MSHKTTPDERLLHRIYEMASGDLDTPVDYILAAKSIGQKETMAKNIVKHLAQANFIKKLSDTMVRLTERGVEWIQHNKG